MLCKRFIKVSFLLHNIARENEQALKRERCNNGEIPSCTDGHKSYSPREIPKADSPGTGGEIGCQQSKSTANVKPQKTVFC